MFLRRPQVLPDDVEETLALLTIRHLGREQAQQAQPASSAEDQQQQGSQQPAGLAELLEQAGSDWQDRIAVIRESLEEGGACERCSAAVRVVCVAPCACLLCVDCASSNRTACPLCATPYRMEASCGSAGDRLGVVVLLFGWLVVCQRSCISHCVAARVASARVSH